MTRRLIGTLEFCPQTEIFDVKTFETLLESRWDIEVDICLDDGCIDIWRDDSA